MVHRPKAFFAEYTGKRILVTGGAGYLATSLAGLLKDVDCRIIRLDRSAAVFMPIQGNASFEDISGDVRQRSIWDEVLGNVDVIFHFAAQTSAYAANENPAADMEINVLPMVQMLESCRLKGIGQIILFSSTVTIAGIPDYLPVNEAHPENPLTIYDLHKLTSENYLKYYTRLGYVRGSVLRLSNVYGPGPRSSRSDRGILNQMTQRAMAGEPLTVYGEGEQMRDYVYVEDVARAFLSAAANIDKLNGRHFIIGSGQGYTIAQAMRLVAERVARKTGKEPVPVIHIDPTSPQSPIEARNFVADSSQFMRLTGWKAEYSLTEGIDHTIEGLL
jgi:UDP-glucose 4-epimerase